MAAQKKRPVALIILDGWGLGQATNSNAITTANPATFNKLWHDYPHATLKASGSAVGLPEGFCGNSEVGHLTIGAGEIIEQSLTHINRLITQNSLCKKQVLQKNFAVLNQSNGALHIIGLLSDGGVHSHEDHLYALIDCATKAGIEKIFIHAILDGRDTLPRSARIYLTKLEEFCKKEKAGVIASICGRFYAMDRDEQWDRTRAAFELYTTPPPLVEHHWATVLEKYYLENITDEFIPPTNLHAEGFIRPEDGVLLFNFRPDRMRQLTSLLLGQEISHRRADITNRPPAPRYQFLISMTRYHKNFTNPVILEQKDTTGTLLDRLEKKKLTIFTIAETEKFAHVTYFFNGGREVARSNETRVLVPSLGIKNYAQKSCMSAPKITEAIVESLAHHPVDFYLVNYANADMVGHSGDLKATIQAVLCVDKQLKVLFEEIVQKRNGVLFIVGDHGNAEEMVDQKTGTPKTSHTTNPVPFIAVNTTSDLSGTKSLADIARIIEKEFE